MSRFEVNKRRRETMQALAAPQRLHAALEAAFPAALDAPAAGSRDLLWRTDPLGEALYILVQSVRRPDFTHMVEQFGWPAAREPGETPWTTREYGSFLAGLTKGERWRFRLRANPVHSVGGRKDSGQRGGIKAHVTVEHQRQWLLDKAAKRGFSIETFDVVHRETTLFTKLAAAAVRRVTLARVTYEGILVVTDAAVLADAMRRGIGRAKAYGCGMLTLAR